jgi:hypothetical protein
MVHVDANYLSAGPIAHWLAVNCLGSAGIRTLAALGPKIKLIAVEIATDPTHSLWETSPSAWLDWKTLAGMPFSRNFPPLAVLHGKRDWLALVRQFR